MKALLFELYLEEPVLATALDGDPNSAVSLSYIPGSLIRGALIAQYLRRNAVDDLARDKQARDLFFDGETRYLNAYPWVDHTRTLPTPVSWKRDKDEAGPVYDFSVEVPEDEDLELKPVKSPYCDLVGDTVTLHSCQMQINVHTQRNRDRGRSVDGGVFRYEALAAGQSFGAVILCPQPLAAILKSLLESSRLLLGGSHQAGYGLTSVHSINWTEDWTETEMPKHEIIASNSFSVTLLSDAVLRGANGQFTGFLTPGLVGAALGTPVRGDAARTHAKAGIVGGFNRKWGLPLPQSQVARAGSVYTFRADAEIPAARLWKLMEEGIGERRVEGYGRLAVNWHVDYDTLKVASQGQSVSAHPQASPLTGTASDLARRMAGRMLRSRLDAHLRTQIKALKIHGDINNAQLSAIRALLRSALSTYEVAPILQRLETMKDAGAEQFDRARVDGQSLGQWIRAVLTEHAEATWGRLTRHMAFDPDALPAVGGVRADWSVNVAREYALRLADGVLSQTLAERRKEER